MFFGVLSWDISQSKEQEVCDDAYCKIFMQKLDCMWGEGGYRTQEYFE